MTDNMGTPYSTGSGLLMATELGAKLQGDFSHIVGLFMPAYPARDFMQDVEMYETHGYNSDEGGKWWYWYEIFDGYPQHSILVNSDGKRFMDEADTYSVGNRDIARQTNATATIICDDATYQNWLDGVVRGLPEGQGLQDKLDFMTSDICGAQIFEADSLEDLAAQMNETGVATYAMNGKNLVATVDEYNAAVNDGTVADLTPTRTSEATVIDGAPYHAIPIRNAIFDTYGGVAIDTSARVLNLADRPIPGLYAAAPCAGATMTEYYAGSIAHAGVTGMWAADTAAKTLGVM